MDKIIPYLALIDYMLSFIMSWAVIVMLALIASRPLIRGED